MPEAHLPFDLHIEDGAIEAEAVRALKRRSHLTKEQRQSFQAAKRELQ